MSKLDPRIEAIRAKYDLDASDFWELPQKKGTWIAKHSALEIVAVKANIVWHPPVIVEADGAAGVAAMIVTATKGDRLEWATGEATPKNNKNAYPWAMAEKRGKDRVVLKLEGIAGLVYSEDEADDFKEPTNRPTPPQNSPEKPAKGYNHYLSDITNAKDEPALKAVFAALWRDKSLTDSQKSDLKDGYEDKKRQLSTPDVEPNFDNLEK